LTLRGTTNTGRIARLNTDGSLDSTFTVGSNPNGRIGAMLVQPDDKVIIAGPFSRFNATTFNGIGRLNANGTIDATFNSGSGPSDDINALALLPDGKLLIAGNFLTYNGAPRTRIAQLNANGSLDQTFNPLATADFGIQALTLDSKGRILIAGDFTSVNGVSRSRIARLLSNGQLDLSFDPGLGANFTVLVLQPQSNGKIIIGGFMTRVGVANRNHIARLNEDGTLDTIFDVGTGADATVYCLALASIPRSWWEGRFSP